LIQSVVCDLRDELSNAILITLNGLIQTDDKQAMKSIARQMKMETQVEGKQFNSLTENMYFLISCLKQGKNAQQLIFIIENFDLFCSHHNQQLLYGLFDVAQSAQTPVCVLGVSSRDDVIELLEKRVKSRFSHRQIFIDPDSDNFDQYLNNFQQMLMISNSMFNSNISSKWNKQVKSLAKDEKLSRSLKQYFQIDSSYSSLKLLIFHVMSSLSDDSSHIVITADDIVKHVHELIVVNDKVHLVTDLSVLELCLLISIKHHCDIYDNDPFNFEIIFNRLNKFSAKSNSMHNITREVVLKSFENLKLQEMITPVGVEGKVQKEYQMYRLQLFADQIENAVKCYQNLPTEVDQWSKSSLI
jgi:origin recognition complex subunit 4